MSWKVSQTKSKASKRRASGKWSDQTATDSSITAGKTAHTRDTNTSSWQTTSLSLQPPTGSSKQRRTADRTHFVKPLGPVSSSHVPRAGFQPSSDTAYGQTLVTDKARATSGQSDGGTTRTSRSPHVGNTHAQNIDDQWLKSEPSNHTIGRKPPTHIINSTNDPSSEDSGSDDDKEEPERTGPSSESQQIPNIMSLMATADRLNQQANERNSNATRLAEKALRLSKRVDEMIAQSNTSLNHLREQVMAIQGHPPPPHPAERQRTVIDNDAHKNQNHVLPTDNCSRARRGVNTPVHPQAVRATSSQASHPFNSTSTTCQLAPHRYNIAPVPIYKTADRMHSMLDDFFQLPHETGIEEESLVKRLGIEIPLPTPYYNGSRDVDRFDDWLTKLLGWMTMYRLDVHSPSYDELRMTILIFALEGPAWKYLHHLKRSHSDHGETLTFYDTIIKLENRFLH